MSVEEMEKRGKVKLDDLLQLKQEHKEIADQSKKLSEYLNQNVFSVFENDKADSEAKLEQLFKVEESSFNFFKKLSKSGVLDLNFPAIEINNLTKFYGNKNIPSLVNVSFKVYFGDFHLIVGPFGSGKTTLFNCLSAREEFEGEILFNSLNYRGDIAKISKVCGFVSHDHEFDQFSSLEDTVNTRLQILGIEESCIKSYLGLKLKTLGLEDKRKTLIIDLPLLDIIKVQILIALAYDCPILVLDQPFLGLQYTEKIELLDILVKLKTQDRAVIVFSNELAELPAYSNSCTLLSEGKVYYSGDIDNLLLESKNKFAISTSDNEECLKILEKYSEKYSINVLKNLVFCTFDGRLNFLLFQRECAEKNIILLEIRKISLELEDIYSTISKVGSKEAKIDINRKRYFSTS
ncbi:ATP-binding cassette domain-containing protein [Candidatus Mycoplasma haematominutum]|uniref:ABC transporter, ATP-binding component n=1 Tax=Candidatus Mycoplasma haematominutum 'Birmingham 1' TaxID=1116213 RepID=G8C2H3_9MOLU|nr:ATP-binding cassette domain-containing protein [Candidatus Mycoplasma haematominutum]CCE66521.1 ABC transporter, ATP-binding component [Candidatus Mycoplasma haematominutum 'Birmingham 1']